MKRLNCLRAFGVGVAVALLLSGAVHAAVSFTFVNQGVALPAIPPAPNPCPPPPALPLNCDITAIGQAQTVSGDMFPPWQFLSVFQISDAFAITGTFLFDDPSAANNDFFGTITGIFDPNTFSSMIDSIVTGGTGMFASASGWGKEVVQIIPSNEGPPTYVSRGQFSIPEPSTAGLLLGAGLLVGAMRRRSK
jgi:PEP-CTERM motif